jgi:hypothetical protein
MNTKTTLTFNETEVKQLVSQVTRGMGKEVPVEQLNIEYITGTVDDKLSRQLEITFSVKPDATPEN